MAAVPKEVAVFALASEPFSKSNINCSIEESLARYHAVTRVAKELSIPVCGYVSCIVGCPVEGAISPSKVAYVAKELYEMDYFEISLGDTIGFTTPAVVAVVPVETLAVHFHDTYGQSLPIWCPLKWGNVATEYVVVYMLNGLGVKTNLDFCKAREGWRFHQQAIRSSIWLAGRHSLEPSC